MRCLSFYHLRDSSRLIIGSIHRKCKGQRQLGFARWNQHVTCHTDFGSISRLRIVPILPVIRSASRATRHGLDVDIFRLCAMVCVPRDVSILRMTTKNCTSVPRSAGLPSSLSRMSTLCSHFHQFLVTCTQPSSPLILTLGDRFGITQTACPKMGSWYCVLSMLCVCTQPSSPQQRQPR